MCRNASDAAPRRPRNSARKHHRRHQYAMRHGDRTSSPALPMGVLRRSTRNAAAGDRRRSMSALTRRPPARVAAAPQQRPGRFLHAALRAVTSRGGPRGILAGMEQPSPPADAPPRNDRLTLDELTALALGADPRRMTLPQLYLGVKGRI